MRPLLRTVSACLLLGGVAQAQTTPMLLALRRQAWAAAQALAAANPDPVAGRVVTFVRLLNQGQGSAGELAAFITANPAWPDQDVLERRFGEALAAEPDEARARAACDAHTPSAASGLLRCAKTWSLAGQPARATQAARQGWVLLAGDPDAEDAAEASWRGTLTTADQQDRFDRLETSDPVAAARQAERLESPARAAALARLALRRRAPDALKFLQSVPAALRSDPRLVLAQFRYLRRTNDPVAALAVWRDAASHAEANVPPERRLAFWTERDALARDMLRAGDAAAAYALEDDPFLAPEQAGDSHFFAGWIALRQLHDAVKARAQFQALADGAHAVITQARALYWLAQVPGMDAKTPLSEAASWPTTYYGQLAARQLGQSDAVIQSHIAALRDPPVAPSDIAALQKDELARAAILLAGWADPRRGADFLRALAGRKSAPSIRAAIAQLAVRLGMPDAAVLAARLAGRDGVVLGSSGWPVPVQPPPGPAAPALVLAVMRQESSFDATATSLTGARGLMQLMPATAAQVARGLGAAPGPLDDPSVNIQLGAAYLGGLLAQFGGQEVFAVAAYNAGPHRVHDWVAAAPEAARDAGAMVDWIELIPFAETRNYVQRVLENEAIYRARLVSAKGAG